MDNEQETTSDGATPVAPIEDLEESASDAAQRFARAIQGIKARAQEVIDRRSGNVGGVCRATPNDLHTALLDILAMCEE